MHYFFLLYPQALFCSFNVNVGDNGEIVNHKAVYSTITTDSSIDVLLLIKRKKIALRGLRSRDARDAKRTLYHKTIRHSAKSDVSRAT